MKLKNKDLINPEFQKIFDQIMNAESFTAKASLRILQLREDLNSQLKFIEQVRLDLLKIHAEVDQKGQVKMNSAKTEYILKNKELFDRDFKDLLEKSFEFEGIEFKILEDLKISPSQLSVLIKTVVYL